jgi:TM2 domain-containing membrane protein YozV
MSDIKWDIYLIGEPKPGIDRPTLVRNLAALFKKEVPTIEKMLRKSRSLIKADVDQLTAKKYQAAIAKAGGQCELLEQGEQLFPEAALAAVEARPVLSVAPVETAPAFTVAVPLAETLEHASPYDTPQADVEGHSHFCFKCAAPLHAGVAHCPQCYAQQPRFSSKNKVAAGFLAFFLGGLGVHRFYLGQWWGVFYLLFAITGIPGLIAFIEALVFWFTPRERWEHKYGQVAGGGAGMAVALVIGVISFVVFLGIAAAVALPAYQDYTARAKMNAALPLINQTRGQVEKVILEKNFLPSENILAGLPENISSPQVQSIRLSDGAQMIVTFDTMVGTDKAPTIIWTPTKTGDHIEWDCLSGSMPDRSRNPECRGGAGVAKAGQ